MESKGKDLPTHIKKEFDAYLKCGRLEQGFLRVRVRCEWKQGVRSFHATCPMLESPYGKTTKIRTGRRFVSCHLERG